MTKSYSQSHRRHKNKRFYNTYSNMYYRRHLKIYCLEKEFDIEIVPILRSFSLSFFCSVKQTRKCMKFNRTNYMRPDAKSNQINFLQVRQLFFRALTWLQTQKWHPSLKRIPTERRSAEYENNDIIANRDAQERIKHASKASILEN